MEICVLAQSVMYFPDMHDVRSKMIGGNAAVSAIRCMTAEFFLSSYYMPPQSNVDLIILNGHLPASSFSSTPPRFYIDF
jgi:hypothetical protein